MTDFGQYEDLTLRLHNLLKEYRDGFGVAKELIQNAEDAGATKVCFLYDERENDQLGVVSEGLAQFQGPALWTYNNKPFSNTDFQNIRKLGGATKEEDSSKVGRFGLGFCSVYNLTDVPSFLSGNRAVIFDPHGKYLESNGKIVDFKTEKYTETVLKWKKQFQPFDGVFQCSLDTLTTQEYQGALFRFPLRTRLQAEESNIKKICYSKEKMKDFINVFQENAGNILLFTQSVRCIGFYYISKNGNPKTETKILFEVHKNINCKQLYSQGQFQPKPFEENVLFQFSKISKNDTEVFVEENISIKYDVFPLLGLSSIESSTEVSWNIIWATGDQTAKQIAESIPLKGKIPLAAVAVCISMDHPTLIKGSPKGFYEEGHLFCFMPLPLSAGYQVHINATFALTQDRGHLCVQSTDETESHEARWNQLLFSHVITSAFVQGLRALQKFSLSDEKTFYNFWPKESCADIDILTGFCRIVVEQQVPIFYSHKGNHWTSLTAAIFLHDDIRNDDHIGDIAFDILRHFSKASGNVLIDLPSYIRKTFSIAGFGEIITERTVDKEHFFEKFFFPNIDDTFLCAERRNMLLAYVLESRSEDILNLVASSDCIPTEPYGVLKKPKDLINPYGKASILFLKEEECFPQMCHHFQQDHLRMLESLGMLKDEISPKLLLSRFKHITRENNSENRFTRVNNLLKYLGQMLPESGLRRFELFHENVLTEIITFPFLPPLEKPQDWPMKWKELQRSRLAPIQLFFEEAAPLVACTQHILDTTKIVLSSDIITVLTGLGVRKIKDVKFDEVIEQLLCVSSLHYPLTSENESQTVLDVCHKLYHHLEKLCTETKLSNTDSLTSVTEKLLGQKVILIGNLMIEPEKIAFSLPLPLEPYLYQLDSYFKIRYPNFLATVGIKQEFQVSDVKNVLGQVEQKHNGHRLERDDLELYCRCLHVLLQITDDSCLVTDVRLPNQDGFLYASHMLCLNDCDWVDVRDEVQFLHECISLSDGRRFGVKTKREASLSRCMSSIPYMKSFGQNERLTSRLKRILEGYPFDICVLNELLQNADDAGATELKLIKDFRNHSTEKVFSDDWKSLQGPALCVFNNSFFSEKDLKGIQELGTGAKGLDHLKTGRYGVGFNVAYHVTDVPSFFSQNPAGDETLCIFDPHMTYAPKFVENGSVSPGVHFTDLKGIRRDFTDIFSCYLHDTVFHQGQGTLFRFPLRTCEMAQRSEISTKEVTPEDVELLLENLKEEVHQTLIFLTHIQKVSICKMTSSGTLETEYTIESTVNRAESYEQLYSYSQCLLKSNIENMDQIEMNVRKIITDSEGNNSNFLIVENVGFACSKRLPLSITSHWKCGDIRLVPRGGVAIPLSAERRNRFKGKLFNVLPLPIETGLPLHVNGHFALVHEARRNLWCGTDDYRYLWNVQTIERIITPAYLSAMLSLREILLHELTEHEVIYFSLSKYHNMFPMMKSTNEHFGKILVQCFYRQLGEGNYSLFPVMKTKQEYFLNQLMNAKFDMEIEWVQINENLGNRGYFNTLANYKELTSTMIYKRNELNDKEKLTWILKVLGLKIIETPISLMNELRLHKVTVKETSPKEVVEYLKAKPNCLGIQSFPSPVDKTLLINTKNVQLLTKFCSQDSDFFAQLEGLPLALTQSTALNLFHPQRPVLMTNVPLLFPNSSREILHECLLQFYITYDTEENVVLKHLNIETISVLLPRELDPWRFMTGSNILWTYHPSSQWLCDLLALINKIILKTYTFKVPTKKDFVHHLKPIEEWSLIPVTMTNHDGGTSGERKRLYPLKEATKIISFHVSTNARLSETLKKVSVPSLDESVFCSLQTDKTITYNTDSLELCRTLIAKMTDPESMLKAVSDTIYNDDCLTVSDCVVILQYFNDNIKNLHSCIELLWKIPYFPTLTGRHIALKLCRQVYVLQDSLPKIPKNGIDELCLQCGITVVIFHSNYKKLTEALKLQVLSVDSFYADILLPHFSEITVTGDKEEHLIYIRDQILHKNNDLNKVHIQILERLKITPFIETDDGSLHVASDFYSTLEDPHDRLESSVVLKTMCKETDFPPPPYDTYKWLLFLNKLGCRNKVSDDDFIKFTQQVENSSKQGLCENLLKKSQVLLKYFLKRRSIDRLFQQIQHIRFIIPFNLVKEAEDGLYLNNLYQQKEGALQLVAFSKAVSPKYYHSVWSSNTMWTLDIDVCIKKADTAMQNCLQRPPTANAVKEHVQHMCSTLKRKPATFIRDMTDVLKKVMGDVYSMVQQYVDNRWFVEDVCQVPLLYIPDEEKFVSPNEVVVDISSSDTIPGYLYKAPVFYGNFHDLFQQLGAHRSPNPDIYANILIRIYERNQGTPLSDTDMAVVGMLLEKMLTGLSSSWTLQVPVVYMPNREKVMTPSDDLVFIDNEFFFERMKTESLNYFTGMNSLKILLLNESSLMSNLPEGKRPIFLSAVVTEQVAVDSQNEVLSSYSNKYEQMMRSTEFVKGIIRLCSHSYQERKLSLSHDDAEEIQECLHSTTIREIEGLETELVYHDRQIQESRRPTACFVNITDTTKIYLNKMKRQDEKAIITIQLSRAIDDLTKGKIGKYATVVQTILDKNPEEIEIFLDRCRIMKFNHLPINETVGSVIYPPVGTPIPGVFHHHLDSNFRCLREGEHVAYCTHDEYTDSTEEKLRYRLRFVYALVIKKEMNYNPLLSRYLIEKEDDDKIWVSASQVYPFKSVEDMDENTVYSNCSLVGPETQFPEDIGGIKSALEKHCENAYGEREWNIIKLRLLSVWHPDGNPDCVNICIELQKFVQFQIQRLDNSPDHGKYALVNLMLEVSRRVAQHPKRAVHDEPITTNSWHQSLRVEAHPDAEEAERWLRQARADVEAASRSLHDDNYISFNWICYMAHQAAEKSLKAVYFTVDSFQAHYLKEHNLKSIASLLEVKDSSLLEPARALQDTVGWHTTMRYPDRTRGTTIPADVYDKHCARKAVDLAKTIYDASRENIY